MDADNLYDIEILNADGAKLAAVKSAHVLVVDAQSMLELLMSVHHVTNSRRIIVEQHNLAPDFFKLSSGLAGETLQKVVNYHFKLAIVGSFEKLGGKALRDFIYESNKGNSVFFASCMEEAEEKLLLAK